MSTPRTLVAELRDAARGAAHSRGDEPIVRLANALEALADEVLRHAPECALDEDDDAVPEAVTDGTEQTAPATCVTCRRPL